ncbi:MAG: hypothetical protein ACXU84_26280, partial [Xanthobacteraceae bacterium]
MQHGARRGRERDDLLGGTLDRDRRRGRRRQRRDRQQQDEENRSSPKSYLTTVPHSDGLPPAAV